MAPRYKSLAIWAKTQTQRPWFQKHTAWLCCSASHLSNEVDVHAQTCDLLSTAGKARLQLVIENRFMGLIGCWWLMDFSFFLFLSLCYSCAVHVAVLIFGLVVLQAQFSGFCMAGCFEKRRPSSLSLLSLCIRAKRFSVQPDSLGWMLRTKHVNVFSEELEEIHFSEGEYKHLFFLTFPNVNLWKKCVFYVKENTNMSNT